MCLSATKCPRHTPHPPLILLQSTNTPEQKHSTTDDFAAPLHDSEDHTDELRLEQSPGDCTEPGSNPFTDPPTHSHSHLSVRAATGWSTHSLHMAPQLQLTHITGHSCTRPIGELPDPPHLSSASEPNTVSPDSEHTHSRDTLGLAPCTEGGEKGKSNMSCVPFAKALPADAKAAIVGMMQRWHGVPAQNGWRAVVSRVSV